MRYCAKCGNELIEDSNFCPNCGKSVYNDNSENSISVILCAIVGLLFPIIGAILYYVLRKTDYKAAKVANICAWISFIIQILVLSIYGFSIFSLF